MQTQCLPVCGSSIQTAAALLRAGEVVAFPTETVYGLGADALNREAVLRIFSAKGRPSDNPLIVHITDPAQAEALCHTDSRFSLLADAFWPGPLTMILPKKEIVPDAVTAGLDSVAIRLPSHPAAQWLIRESGVPVAAPSANRSGRPSPTTAQHVWEDLNGLVPLILDGGPCDVGVESTVVSLTGAVPMVLRPGWVSPEMLRQVLGEVRVADSVMRPLREGESAPSPGMRHKHYAPKAPMTLFGGEPEKAAALIRARYDALGPGERPLILCAQAHLPWYGNRNTRSLGADAASAAQRLFSALRWADDNGITRVLSESYGTDGIGLALMNRMVRAAGFDMITEEEKEC